MSVSTFNACLALTNNAMIQYKFVLTAYHNFELECSWTGLHLAQSHHWWVGKRSKVALQSTTYSALQCIMVHYWVAIRSGQPWIWCNLAISNSPISSCYDIPSYYYILFRIPHHRTIMYYWPSSLPSHPIPFLTMILAKDPAPADTILLLFSLFHSLL